MKPFLIIYNPSLGNITEFTNFLDTKPEVLNWVVLPVMNTVIITSNLSTNQLMTMINQKYCFL